MSNKNNEKSHKMISAESNGIFQLKCGKEDFKSIHVSNFLKIKVKLTYNEMHNSVSFDKCIYLCNQDYNQNIKHFQHLERFHELPYTQFLLSHRKLLLGFLPP